jgi:hypothetical protein
MADYEYTCPCGGRLATADYQSYRDFVKAHNVEHIEKIFELKSKTPSLPPLQSGGGQVIYTPCSCKTVVTG